MYLLFLFLYFLWLTAQNLVLPWTYHQGLLDAARVGVLMASKEAILMVAILALVPRLFRRDFRLTAADKFAAAYGALLTFYLVFGPRILGSDATFTLRLISWRGLISLVLFYAWGRLSFLNFRELRRLTVFVLGLQVAAALFGVYEWLFLPASFWRDTVGAGSFMLDVKGLMEGQNVIDGLPSNMFKFGVRRAISSYGDPLALGIASVFPLLLCVAWLARDRAALRGEADLWRWWLALAVIAAGLVLTIGRESIGAAALGVAIVVWRLGKSSRLVVPYLVLFLLLAVVPQVWSYVVRTVTFKESTAATHLDLFLSGWQHLPKLIPGKGLGEAGGWAFSLVGTQPEVGESSYFELMAQTGALSLALLLGFLFSTARAALQYSRQLPDALLSSVFLAAAAHILARSVLAVFSPSLFGVIPLASFFFLCGALFSAMERVKLRPALTTRRLLVLREAGPTDIADMPAPA